VVPLGVPDLEEIAAVSPTMLAAVPQDHTEPVLLRHLEALGLTEVRFGTELAALDQDAGGVTVVLRERPGGAVRTVRAGHVIGADGAHSLVRRLLGIPMAGPDHLSELITVLFEAPLAEVAGDRRHGIYLVQHPQAAGVLVPNGVGDRWLYGREWDPSRERFADYTDARLTGLIRTAGGVGDLPVRIVAKGAFSFAAQVADRYRSGRVFLAGDAAQRMTPRGGMGMNTAMAEANDLAWKLAWVHKGWAGPELLDTYETEWRPIGIRRTTRSAQEGPRPDGAEALADDLNHRLRHTWLPEPRLPGPGSAGSDGHRRSTLDLLGPGLTLLTGPDARPWTAAAATLDTPFPLTVHTLDPSTATALRVEGGGAVLVRPDAQVVAHWPTAPADPAGQLRSWARTLAAWPSALTLCQARSTRPCSSRRKVERRTPTEVRP
jgi:putative polyketide hydroxylase